MTEQGANDDDEQPADDGAEASDVADAPAQLVRVADTLLAVDQEAFDACANPEPARYNPFVAYAFLEALEASGCVRAETGWLPQHLILEDENGRIIGAAPAYLKTHSQGEFVFDHAWADAYQRAGGSYYPKLQLSVPFTPVPGPRLMVLPGEDAQRSERVLAAAAVELARRMKVSSVHVTFLEQAAWERLGGMGYLQRTDQQFHFSNPGYGSFDDFLATLASRKRKAVRKERAQATEAGLQITHVIGADITEAHWDAFFDFYIDTGSRKWGSPYLNREFFSLIGERMADRCLLMFASHGGRFVAGALNMIGGDCLYGRYWGASEYHPCLHFELCYYQAIDYAIAHGLARVEAGAQGQHKLARGYVPETTYSAHWIADPGLSRAVERYLEDERRHVEHAKAALNEYTPFRKGQQQHDRD
ncbi:MAG: GNAT family N-acetyltransferase [Alphaproteobacteria bacterium]|nr:GNAT family N-acetyltransferase [Alphaproteobacteria bacterium]